MPRPNDNDLAKVPAKLARAVNRAAAAHRKTNGGTDKPKP